VEDVMHRIGSLLLTCCLGVVLLAGNFSGHATAQKNDKGAKGKLPDHWPKLGLSAEQKIKVYKIQADYDDKITPLKKQIEKLEADEKQEMFKVLTDNQKDQLRKIYLDKLGVDPFAPPKKELDTKKVNQ
jgi:hypothetical protein